MSGDTLPVLTRLGNFELLRLLAQGGMADIYLARCTAGNLERFCAVKVLNNQRANDPEACALFLDEARLLAMLNHHNVGTVYEVDVESGVHYLAMEYVHGADLREIMHRAAQTERPIPYETAISIVAAAAAGLDHAHRRCAPDGKPLHLVHRDVSLSNIMVGHDGAVKVVDFGIASSSTSSVETQPGVVRGKASYMSPEQCLGDDIDLRTDVFALGIVLYELTTGRRCFQGGSDFERMIAVVRGDFVPPSVHVPAFSPALEAIIKVALSIDPANRFSSAAAMIEALEELAAREGWITGQATVARFMRELFGEVSEPWNQPAAAEDIELARSQAPRTRVITRPRRFPNGTEGTPIVNDDDDAPTRGRRSVPRMTSRVMLPDAGDSLPFEPIAA